jgi:hypothetical protein
MMFCFHDRLRQHTFVDGAIIKMCPDCTTFDFKRVEALKTGRIASLKSDPAWEAKLKNNSLSMSGEHEWLMYLNQSSPLEKTVIEQKSFAYDHDWATNQAPFPHSLPMPRHYNYICLNCTDQVVEVIETYEHPWSKRVGEKPITSVTRVIRETKGVYLPVEHDCPRVRVYDLQGKLLEVK